MKSHDTFIETIAAQGNVSKDVAVKVAAYYLKNKIAKCDVHTGQYAVSHGAFLDADVIARAVEIA